jgi:hypothetical protein
MLFFRKNLSAANSLVREPFKKKKGLEALFPVAHGRTDHRENLLSGGTDMIAKPKGEAWFLASCVEVYKDEKGLTGQAAYNYPRKNGRRRSKAQEPGFIADPFQSERYKYVPSSTR